MKWALAFAYVVACGLGEITWAEDGGSPSDSKRAWLLEKFDTNGDGKLDSQERETARKVKILKKFDTNGDGKLDERERDAIREARKKIETESRQKSGQAERNARAV